MKFNRETIATLEVAVPGGGITEPVTLHDVLTSDFINASVLGAAIVDAGTGGITGPGVVTGTTGTGTMFQADVMIDVDGKLQSITSISVAGSYTVPPTDPTNEPVIGMGLAGAALAVELCYAPAICGSNLNTNPLSPGLKFGAGGFPSLSAASATFNVGVNDGAFNQSDGVNIEADTGSTVVLWPYVGQHGAGILEIDGYGSGTPEIAFGRDSAPRGDATYSTVSGPLKNEYTLGQVSWLGTYSTTYNAFETARIEVRAVGAWDGTNAASLLNISTSKSNTHTRENRFIIDGDGNTNILNGVLAIATAVAISALPASPVPGMFATVNDALTPVVGAPVASGGAAPAVVCWGGTQWTVVSI